MHRLLVICVISVWMIPGSALAGDDVHASGEEDEEKVAAGCSSGIGVDEDGNECVTVIGRSTIVSSLAEYGSAFDDCTSEEEYEIDILDLQWSIGPFGRVSSTEVKTDDLRDTDVGNCIASVVQQVQFPRLCPQSAPREVTLPFDLNRDYERSRPWTQRIRRNEIASTLQAKYEELNRCLPDEFSRESINVEFDVLFTGRADDVEVDDERFQSSDVDECIAAVFRQIEFPKTSPVQRFQPVVYPVPILESE